MSLVLTGRPHPHLAVVTLNNPDRLNALSMPMVAELHEALDEIGRSDTRVIILTGAGRGFCSGLDLSEPAIAPTAQNRSGPAAGMRLSAPGWSRTWSPTTSCSPGASNSPSSCCRTAHLGWR